LQSAIKEILPDASDKDLLESDLVSLGADSVSFVKLQQLIKRELHEDISVQELYEGGSFQKLTQKLVYAANSQREPSKQDSKAPKVDYDALVRSFFPSPSTAAHLLEPSWPPKSILLTGSTGFLGTYILSELLKSSTSDIYLLVRSKNPNELVRFISEQFAKLHLLWAESYESRLHLVRPRVLLFSLYDALVTFIHRLWVI